MQLVNVDSRLILQVIINIVDNAVKYTTPVPTGNACKIIITFVSFLQPNIFLIPCRIFKKGANNDTILRIVLQKGIGLC